MILNEEDSLIPSLTTVVTPCVGKEHKYRVLLDPPSRPEE